MNNKEIIKKVETHVRELYEAHLDDIFVYHDLEHVEKVVEAADQISNHYKLNKLETQAVHIAAWFHDVGYLLYHSNGHEVKSAELAVEFLKQENANQELIKNVKEAILATKVFSKPTTLTAKIVADADLFNLGTSDFRKTNKKMWVEMKRYYGKKIPAHVWYKSALDLLEKHQYHTEYCRNLLQEGKQENIDLMKKWLEENGS
ncbi:HD domain-containing protein [Rhodohalobacter sulfatireducens]|uniref:HD domain-containing protein n=1 Tax=Rhodohalobacter sulfatireducens TaxID=2911366 RepID=A0ABS9K8M1_9BACT|nr:HD domain-containing protein [Rhodohalobacter sulfatireducens]MCG2587207.1 HD domain-containing protein [Rhodohalobacter sulfatireducens]MDR9365160.1 HD domain-containing protein [Balneolaceae bacterium]